MKTTPIITLALLGASLLASCSSKPRTSQAAQDHQAWIASLADSITAAQAEIQHTGQRIDALHDSVARMLTAFTHVSSPRQVEGYTVLRSQAASLPLTRTALAARITESEGFELLSALTGATYCRLRVTSPAGTATTATVPHDQALNYRHDGYNTVAFTGTRADSVGRLIALSPEGSVQVQYLTPDGRKAGSLQLPPASQQAIAQTWRLAHTQHTAETLERRISLLNRRIALFRLRLEQNAADSAQRH